MIVFYITCFQSIGGLIALAWDCADVKPNSGYLDKITTKSAKKYQRILNPMFTKEWDIKNR